MAEPTDKDLYEKVKKEIYKKYPEHSAYRSGLLVKKYKKEYEKKHKSKNAYKGQKKLNEGLNKWFDEKWLNQRGEVGYKLKGDIYRPTIKINDKTPTTFNELTKNQINNAMKEKKLKGRVSRFNK